MATRRPLVRVAGRVVQLPSGDTLPAQAPISHSHEISDVTGLPAALAGKQSTLTYKITVSTTAPDSPAVGDIWISY